jgi:Protein kinase domain
MQVELLAQILAAASAGFGVVKGAIAVYPTVAKVVRDWTKKKSAPDPSTDDQVIDLELAPVDPGKLMQFVHQLGLATEADVEQAMAKWPSPEGFTDAQRNELTTLLKKLVSGARFHSTHGTKLSNYLSAERLLEQLLDGIQPKMTAGVKLGNWTLTTFLGMGGFGEVWKAQNTLFPAPRVFKFFTQEGARAVLEREAEVLFAVGQHLTDCPNVIDYQDVDIDAQPFPYLALEFATLGTLEDWVLTPPGQRAKIGLTELMKGIVRGVSDAHRHGIHHRDLKPANILLTGVPDDVTPKVADFGLGRVAAPAEAQSSYRSHSVLVGTSMYLPPEAANPFKQREFAQDDVFALGVVWFQVLTGRLVRPSYDFAEELALAGADSRSVRLISRCLARPERRYEDACELYADMDAEDPPPGPGEWDVPDGCFDVAGIAREYLERSRT